MCYFKFSTLFQYTLIDIIDKLSRFGCLFWFHLWYLVMNCFHNMKPIKEPTSITCIIGLCQAQSWSVEVKCTSTQETKAARANVLLDTWGTCAQTHTNGWSWVITRECCTVHQYSIRQTSWIFISLFTLPAWQTRQKALCWDMSLAQSDTLRHRHRHTRWFTYTDRSLW